MQQFSLLIKPSGSDCNLDCSYCFYKCRAPEIGQGRQRMSHEVLEKMVKDYLGLRFAQSSFSWQGGEPMLMGIQFYEDAVELQKKYAQSGQVVSNALQTNAVLMDKRWCEFLRENKFLVGISIDGPKELHDCYRVDHSGGGSFDKVMAAIELCKEHKVEFNILVLLNDKNVVCPDELFDFFVIENGIKYLQFIPCVETDPATGEIADFSVKPEQYGQFMCRMFDRWYEYGPTKVSIRDFDSILFYCVSGRHTICTFDKQCSQYIVIEHSGDAFCCDFFVEPKWRLGNIMTEPIEQLANSSKKKKFARAKQQICNKCLICRHLELCRGGCLKNRKAIAGSIVDKQSYLCEGYIQFFDYTLARFRQLAASVVTNTANGSL